MALSRKPIEIVAEGKHQLLIKANHWERIALFDVAIVQNGFPFKSGLFTHSEGKQLIRIRDIEYGYTENFYAGDYSDEYLVRDGDILIGMDGDFTAAIWRGSDGLLNQRVCRLIKCTNYFVKKFLFLCLQPYLNAINAETSSVTVKHLSSNTIGEIPLPLPPLNEQHRIVAKIEELFSELDKGVESLKTAREQLKVYRQALLKHAFEGKLTAQWRKENPDKLETANALLKRIQTERTQRYQQELEKWEAAGKQGSKPKALKSLPPLKTAETAELAKLPESWSWVKVGVVGSVGTGGTPLKGRSDFYADGTIPWVTSGALNENFVIEASDYVTEVALNETNLRIYPKHTLLIAMYGEGKTRGKCSELLIEATTNQAIAAIVQDGLSEKLRKYMKWFFQKNYGDIRLKSSGGVQPNLNLSIIESTLFPMCSIEEADFVVGAIESKMSEVDQLEQSIATSLQQSKTLRQSILKKAFSGQLVPQDPKDEPASALLARIKAERVAAVAKARKASTGNKLLPVENRLHP